MNWHNGTNGYSTGDMPSLDDTMRLMKRLKVRNVARRDQVHEMLKSYGGFLDPDGSVENWVLPDAVVARLQYLYQAEPVSGAAPIDMMGVQITRLSDYQMRGITDDPSQK